MNILWITNIMLPPICKSIDIAISTTGGWMYSALKRLVPLQGIGKIAVATVYQGKKFVEREIDGVTYFLLPLKGKSHIKYNPHLESQWIRVREVISPDIVHIHGSEYPYGLAYVKACGGERVIVSLQGIISGIARYYTSGIDLRDIIGNLTFRDIVKHDTMFMQQEKFTRRGRLEKELLSAVRHVIGRTEWDRAHALALNSSLHYHYCGETLRDAFYSHKWSYENCEPHSIFVSQAGYPIKGLHILLRAMRHVLRQYPDARIYVAGGSIVGVPWYRVTGYAKYVKRLIRKYELEDRIEFTGSLDEQQMCLQYLKCNVFVCCSAIENSPNSLGEAQLLGTPHVASFVGGVPEIVNYNPDVLYRFEEHEMLAERICRVFEKGPAAHGAEFDQSRYDREVNISLLTDIYNTIQYFNTFDT